MPQTDEQKRFLRKARKVARRLFDDYDRACEAHNRRLTLMAPEVDRISDELNRIVGTIADGDPDPKAIMARIRSRAANASAAPEPGPTTGAKPAPPTPPQPPTHSARTEAPPQPKPPVTPSERPPPPRPPTPTSEPSTAPEPPSPELLEVRRQIAAVEARILLDTERERLVRLNLESLRQRRRLADHLAELAALDAELAAASSTASLAATTPSTAPEAHRGTTPGAEAAHPSTATPPAAANIPAAPTASIIPASPHTRARPHVAEPAPTDIGPSNDLPDANAETAPSAQAPASAAPPVLTGHPGADAETAPDPTPPSLTDQHGAPTPAPPVVDHPRAPTHAPAPSSVVPDLAAADPIAIIHLADDAMADGDHLRAAALFAAVEALARPAYQATVNADGAAAFLVSILRGAAEAHLALAALADALPKSQESFALAAQLHDDDPSPVSLADLAASARVHAEVLRACGRPADAAGLIDDTLLLATRARPRLHSEDLRHELKCILALRRDLERDPHRAPPPSHDAHH